MLRDSQGRASAPYWWRLCFTALSFTLFGLGGLFLRLFCFPILFLFTDDLELKQKRSRYLIHLTFKIFIGFMRWTGVISYQIKNAEQLGQPGQLIIANHPSLIDVVLLIAQTPNANCIVKESLWNNVFMRGPIRAAGYISNNGSVEMLDEAVAALQAEETLIIFPEGTRTTPGHVPEFHRGAAAIGLKGAKVVTPVVISVTPSTLTKSESWYQIPKVTPFFLLEVKSSINPRNYTKEGSTPKASRQLNNDLHNFYLQELFEHD
ncbi:lysophospholipid acyltransferase family protein [Thiopseudomonas alkaliphila]|uniref:Acyltransferase n=1 Tax=Thiopseudomonas alkaliphila TaxID=1697053 RepID=A0A0K1XEM4_9GAMM|nr:lysophospholipid acyltransferase family protein [Thiopseudomonas alkaliphila]AKX59613.1 acyltransferase [Thiopseudomonas alkaliphila]MDM1696698.1 1-acyl-sn-glycerol-3-phosphate acyltransferase [Thiopseudomonas alkaliphila]MDM1716757.1 1-acyl-sn-glycerol-3-phosphate acyltransferase [Thiopseudomonas alkaliphila]